MTDLVRWNPYSELSRMRESIDRVFAPFWGPSVDVAETNGHISVHAEIPGVDPDDLELMISEDGLTISGEVKQDSGIDRQGGGQVGAEPAWRSADSGIEQEILPALQLQILPVRICQRAAILRKEGEWIEQQHLHGGLIARLQQHKKAVFRNRRHREAAVALQAGQTPGEK